jgi:Ribbon-helix-helix protein, copG family.
MQITITLNDAQHKAVESAAAKTGKDREQVVLQALDQLLLREELGADDYARLMAGLADIEAGRFASDERVDAVFNKYGVQRR